MSDGPIKAERAARTVGEVSTPNVSRVCMQGPRGAYCGRSSSRVLVSSWVAVRCADCVAAGRADGIELTPVDRGRS